MPRSASEILRNLNLKEEEERNKRINEIASLGQALTEKFAIRDLPVNVVQTLNQTTRPVNGFARTSHRMGNIFDAQQALQDTGGNVQDAADKVLQAKRDNWSFDV